MSYRPTDGARQIAAWAALHEAMREWADPVGMSTFYREWIRSNRFRRWWTMGRTRER